MTTEIKRELSKEGQESQKVPAGRMPVPWEDMERMFERFMPQGWLRPAFWEWPSWSFHTIVADGSENGKARSVNRLPCMFGMRGSDPSRSNRSLENARPT